MKITTEQGNPCLVPIPDLPDSAHPMWLEWIPSGSFTMGCHDEHEQYIPDVNHQFSVKFTYGFWIGRYVVTEAHWKDIITTNTDRIWQGYNKPIVNVTWYDAMDFCHKLNHKLKDYLGEYEFRLPSEAEWEYVHSTGSVTKNPELREVAWHSENTKQLMDVGLKSANKWNLYDMQGNVIEWCYDGSGYDRPHEPSVNYVGSYDETTRHVRGGSYNHLPSDFMFFDCSGDDYIKTTKRPWLGFRLCLVPKAILNNSEISSQDY